MFETLAISRDDPKTIAEIVAGSMTHIVWKVPIALGQPLTGRAAETAWFNDHRLLTRILVGFFLREPNRHLIPQTRAQRRYFFNQSNRYTPERCVVP